MFTHSLMLALYFLRSLVLIWLAVELCWIGLPRLKKMFRTSKDKSTLGTVATGENINLKFCRFWNGEACTNPAFAVFMQEWAQRKEVK